VSTLTTEEQSLARAALQQAGHHPRLSTEDGTLVDVPASVTDALAEVLEAAADGERALVLRVSEDLTTAQAAAVLGVSRPTVVRLIDAGKLPAQVVGTHRRVALSDVIAYREASASKRRAALDRMAQQAQDLGLYD
jgi:excisionase family DNA binding protein